MPEFDSVAIYIADPSLLIPKLFGQLEGLRKIEQKEIEGKTVGLRFHLSAAVVTLNYLPEEERRGHMAKFAGFSERILASDAEALAYVKSRSENVKRVLAGFAEPGFDNEGRVLQFLVKLCSLLNGFMFVGESVVDYDGQILLGPPLQPGLG
jgi:hypothetical protein